jgi:prophage antirepressor-like protein
MGQKEPIGCRLEEVAERNFMGIELDGLTGHPEHDLLFVATQVARAAGLKNPSMAVQGMHSKETGVKLQVGTLSLSLKHRDGRAVPSNSWLFDRLAYTRC